MSKELEYDPIEKHLPKEGWLNDFITFTKDLEACPRFRFFAAACSLGAAINNRVYVYRGDPDLLPKLFPNIWVLLLAPPGRGHKTSTINMGINLLIQACPEVRILADKLTPESLVKALAAPSEKEVIRIGPRDATGIIKAPELSVFFGKQQYNTGLVSLITDLYDWRPEWVSETIGRGTITLRNICISIIGGSTPDWLQSMLPQDAFTGGFMSRFLLVEMPPRYVKRRAKPKRIEGLNWEELVRNLTIISKIDGEMKWSKDGDDYYTEMYEHFKPTGDVQYDAYRERETEQTIRLAMLLSLSRGELLITGDRMQEAHNLLSCLLNETKPRIQQLTTTPRMNLVQVIKNYIRSRGPMTRQQLLNATYRQLTHGEQQFNEAIRVLCMAYEIKPTAGSKPDNPTYILVEDKEL